MTRASVALILIGILSLLAAPLATAQTAPSGETARASNQRDGMPEPPSCPDGFQLTDDLAYCYEQPVIVTTQAPVDCEVGHLTPNFAACYTQVSYISQAPTSEFETIDAHVSPNPATLTCPSGFELSPDQVFCQATVPGPAVPIISDGEPYCADGSSVQPDGMCYVQGTAVGAGLYVPAMPAIAATPAMCPDGTDPSFVQNGLCKVSDASPLPTPCLADELEILNIFDNGFERVVCFAGLPQIPAMAAVAATPTTCEGEPTTAPASACIVTIDTSFPVAPLLTEGEFLRCDDAGFVLGADEQCFAAVAPHALANPPTITCPSGFVGPVLGEGPGAGYVCTRTILTAQPDLPVCKAGTLLDVGPESPGLDTGDDFICLLDNPPVAPAPISMPSCPKGDYSAKDDLCLLMPEGGKAPVTPTPGSLPVPPPTPVPIPGGPITETLPFIVTAIGDQADAPPTWVFNIESNCLDEVTDFHVPTSDTFGAESYSEFPIEAEAADGTACTYTVTEVPYLDWLTDLPAGGYTFTPLETGVPLLFVQIYQPGLVQLGLESFIPVVASAPPPHQVDFTISGVCLDEPLMATLDTGGQSYADTTIAVPKLDSFGNTCVYRVEVAPLAGLTPIKNPIEVVVRGNNSFASFEHVPTDLVGGAITIHKESTGDPSTAPPEWEFTITSTCLDAPVIVTMPSAPTFEAEQIATVDGLDLDCAYMISETPTAGYLDVNESYAFPGASRPVEQARFFNREIASAEGVIYFYKYLAGGDEGYVFGFDVTSDCLAEPAVVYVGIYGGSGNAELGELALVDDNGAPCVYIVTARPAEGVSTIHGDAVTTIDLLAANGYGSVGSEKITDDYSSPLRVAKTAEGELANAPDTFDLVVSSPCLSDPINVSLPSAPAFRNGSVETIRDLPKVDASGALCEYLVTEPHHDGYTVIEPSAVTLDAPHPVYAGVFNIEVGLAIGEVTIFKEAFGDPTNAPEFWEFTISSPCFDPIVIEMLSAPTFDGGDLVFVGNLPVNDASGFCEVTVTETAVPGFAQSPPRVQTFEFGPYLLADQVKVETGQGYTSGIRVLKYGFDSIDQTGPFELVLESTCLDSPIVIEVDPAELLDDSTEITFQDLPVESGGELCVYDVAPVEVDGVEHAFDGVPMDITLSSDLTYVVLAKGPTGSFDDAITPLPGGSVPAQPPVQPPAPPPTPFPTPHPSPSPTPPTPAPDPAVSVPVPVVGSVSTPASTAPVAAASVDFGGSTPTTPASMLGATSHNSSGHTSAPLGSSTTPLAHTGGEARYLTSFGLLLITLGAIMMVFARRRVDLDPFADPFSDPLA